MKRRCAVLAGVPGGIPAALSQNWNLAAYYVVAHMTEMTARKQCKDLIEEHFPEGLIRTLEGKFPASRFQDLEDAVAEGFVKFLAKGEVLETPAGYITVVAIHYTRRLLLKATREVLPEDDLDDDAGDGYWADPTAERVGGKATFELARQIIENWQSLNVRSATLLVLEAVELEEPVSSAELADELESQLDEDVLPDTARQWRKRGLDRLRRELYELENRREGAMR